jgi:hypothetical protein
MLAVLSGAQFGERRYGQLKSNLAFRLNATFASAAMAVLAEAALDDQSLLAASIGSRSG